jgi:hypothetical protein
MEHMVTLPMHMVVWKKEKKVFAKKTQSALPFETITSHHHVHRLVFAYVINGMSAEQRTDSINVIVR